MSLFLRSWVLVVLGLILRVVPLALVPVECGAAQPSPTYAGSDGEFQGQLNAVVRASCAGDSDTAARLADQFALPDAVAWFARNFDASGAAKLAERYRILASRHSDFLKLFRVIRYLWTRRSMR
jgi:hypothetical protein